MALTVVNAFAGPGGWCEGVRLAGYTGPMVGVEWDRDACRTGMAAGHARVRADVASFPLARLIGKVDGLIASPPCPTFGYAAWVGVLSAEEHGVPQTRKRAFLLARCDGLPVGPPEPTHQAYRAGQAYDTAPVLFGPPLPPPVSMADALGWSGRMYPAGTTGSYSYSRECGSPAPTVTTVGNQVVAQARNSGPAAEREPHPVDAPSYTIRSQGSGSHPSGTEWVLRNGNQANDCERRACEPAGTLFFGGRTNAVDWVQTERQANGGTRPGDAPSLTITASLDNGNMRWTTDRPATTVCADPRIGAPGHRDRAGGEPQFGEKSVRVSVQEAAVLQSFHPDYPWQGTKSSRYAQVGNAVPPLLAAAVLRQFLPGRCVP